MNFPARTESIRKIRAPGQGAGYIRPQHVPGGEGRREGDLLLHDRSAATPGRVWSKRAQVQMDSRLSLSHSNLESGPRATKAATSPENLSTSRTSAAGKHEAALARGSGGAERPELTSDLHGKSRRR